MKAIPVDLTETNNAPVIPFSGLSKKETVEAINKIHVDRNVKAMQKRNREISRVSQFTIELIGKDGRRAFGSGYAVKVLGYMFDHSEPSIVLERQKNNSFKQVVAKNTTDSDVYNNCLEKAVEMAGYCTAYTKI